MNEKTQTKNTTLPKKNKNKTLLHTDDVIKNYMK